ncbi:MAG: diaminopimelate decarboxylase [Desulfovibrionaceae bacterium]|nr:diaminopimelate decarboxylase [Desulfovibrionaceae bacterium]
MPNVRSTYTDSIRFFGKEDPRELAARFGTPLYVYNETVLRQRCRELKELSSHPGFTVNYSAKANTNLAILRIIREEGCVVDAMSPGELRMDMLAGFPAEHITYISNNISREEMRNAIDHQVLMSVDSLSQLEQYGQLNPGGKVMVRFNPGIGTGHHRKVVTAGKETKFGVTPDSMDRVFAILDAHNLTLAGINQHIGSLFMTPDGYLNAAEFLLHLAEGLPAERLAALEVIDFGGGFGIPYRKYDGEARLDMNELGTRLHALISAWAARTGYAGRFFVEPGRYAVAECGVLLGGAHCVKNNGENRYVGTDIGFNVLVRPAMYDSFHDVEIYRENGTPDEACQEQSIVGNICESGDVLAKKRPLPEIREGDVLGILDAGAYGYVMASTYNQRPRPAEVMITADGTARLIRRRETVDDLLRCYEGLQ